MQQCQHLSTAEQALTKITCNDQVSRKDRDTLLSVHPAQGTIVSNIRGGELFTKSRETTRSTAQCTKLVHTKHSTRSENRKKKEKMMKNREKSDKKLFFCGSCSLSQFSKTESSLTRDAFWLSVGVDRVRDPPVLITDRTRSTSRPERSP